MSGCCSACGEECGDLISLGFTQVCRYCFREPCLEEPLLEDFGPDFLERQGADFFLSWWWGGDAYLTEEEKLEAVISIFAKREKRFRSFLWTRLMGSFWKKRFCFFLRSHLCVIRRQGS